MPAQALGTLPQHNRDVFLGKDFFPNLISDPFRHGLRIAFAFSIVLFTLAAIASWLHGGKYVYEQAGPDDDTRRDEAEAQEETAGVYKTVVFQEDDEDDG